MKFTPHRQFPPPLSLEVINHDQPVLFTGTIERSRYPPAAYSGIFLIPIPFCSEISSKKLSDPLPPKLSDYE